jgi:hypothetical protein
VSDRPPTEELLHRQARREAEERRELAESELPDERKQHARRSDKAAYLRRKLAERKRSEQDSKG